MAKQQNNESVPAILRHWWADAFLAVAFLAAAYGFASWAIDSGRILGYVLTILFLASAIKSFVMALKKIFKRNGQKTSPTG